MNNKLSFNQWLRVVKSFNSKEHFNNFIRGLSIVEEKQNQAKIFYQNQYENWCKEN